MRSVLLLLLLLGALALAQDTLVKTLRPATPQISAKFGAAVAMVGGYLAVGAPGTNLPGVAAAIGSVYVYDQQAPNNTWIFSHRLDNLTFTANGNAGASLSGRKIGSTPVLAVGVPGDVSRGSAVVFSNPGGTFINPAYFNPVNPSNGTILNTNFPTTLALRLLPGGVTPLLLAGNPLMAYISTTGVGYVHAYNYSKTVIPNPNPDVSFTFPTSPDLNPDGGFGSAVDMDESTGLVAVGAPGVSSFAGQLTLMNFTSGNFPALVVNSSNSGAYFGNSLTFVNGGSHLVVCAPRENTNGQCHVYSKASNWAEVQLIPAVTTGGNYRFGASIASSGTRIAIGAPLELVGGAAAAGAVHVFNLTSAGNFTFLFTLTETVPAAGNNYGTSVAMDGIFLAVGSPNFVDSSLAGAGSVYLYCGGTAAQCSAPYYPPPFSSTSFLPSGAASRAPAVGVTYSGPGPNVTFTPWDRCGNVAVRQDTGAQILLQVWPESLMEYNSTTVLNWADLRAVNYSISQAPQLNTRSDMTTNFTFPFGTPVRDVVMTQEFLPLGTTRSIGSVTFNIPPGAFKYTLRVKNWTPTSAGSHLRFVLRHGLVDGNLGLSSSSSDGTLQSSYAFLSDATSAQVWVNTSVLLFYYDGVTRKSLVPVVNMTHLVVDFDATGPGDLIYDPTYVVGITSSTDLASCTPSKTWYEELRDWIVDNPGGFGAILGGAGIAGVGIPLIVAGACLACSLLVCLVVICLCVVCGGGLACIVLGLCCIVVILAAVSSTLAPLLRGRGGKSGEVHVHNYGPPPAAVSSEEDQDDDDDDDDGEDDDDDGEEEDEEEDEEPPSPPDLDDE